MAWLYLFVAGLFEVGWAIGLKYTEGFSRLVPSLLTVAAMIISLALLGLALKTLPVGTAYAVWTGIGAVGTAALGIYLFGEPATAARLASIGLIVAGIVGVKARHKLDHAGKRLFVQVNFDGGFFEFILAEHGRDPAAAAL